MEVRNLPAFGDSGAEDVRLRDIERFLAAPFEELACRSQRLSDRNGRVERTRQRGVSSNVLGIQRRLDPGDAQSCHFGSGPRLTTSRATEPARSNRRRLLFCITFVARAALLAASDDKYARHRAHR
jgi:hypothetical protein